MLFIGLYLLGTQLPFVQDFAMRLYALGSRFYALVSGPIDSLNRTLNVPAIGAFLLGLLAATAPCQLSTNAAAIAYFSGGAVRTETTKQQVWGRVLTFAIGKIGVYLTLAAIAIWIFDGDFAPPVALFSFVRQLLGPLMLIIGLAMLGFFRLRGGLPDGLAIRLKAWSEARGGYLGAFSLGSAFGLAFCPTLFWLFFGLMLPTAIESRTGLVYPMLFAVATITPLFLMVGLLSHFKKRDVLVKMRGFHRMVATIAGCILVVAGLYDTVVYWSF